MCFGSNIAKKLCFFPSGVAEMWPGEEFFIGHNPTSSDSKVAEEQAKWLEKVLADEHDREKKHSDRIELPD
ncbi:MAG: hypothetical protein NVS9B5_33630 [Terriglobales bacterium]